MAEGWMYSIGWHEDCLQNSKKFLFELTEKMNRLKAEIEKTESENAFRSAQIRKAVKMGKTHFDPDRFMKKERDKFNSTGRE